MFYDLNISNEFSDFNYFEKINCYGVCQTYDFLNLNDAFVQPRVINSSKIPIYTRCNIEFNTKIDPSVVNRLSKIYNLVCIRTNSFSYIPTIAKLKPDLVQIPLEEIRHIKKNTSGLLNESKLFIEIVIRDGIYNKRLLFMNVINKLLKYNCRKHIVISSGAKIFTELKSYNDLWRILRLFNKNDKIIKSIINNASIVLKNAAMKRYSTNNTIINSENEGRFKNDFILNSLI